MTFAYINYSFNLPPDMLRDVLNIENKRYPDISLWSYIKKWNLDKDATLTQIKEVIKQSYSEKQQQ